MNNDVLEAVRQWLAKAESDWTTVEILTADVECPTDSVCFHCQQYVEKLLKALLTLKQVEAPRTHDLRRLCELAAPHAPTLLDLTRSATALTLHAVHTRYPGDLHDVTPEEMQEVLDMADAFAVVLLPLLREYLPRED